MSAASNLNLSQAPVFNFKLSCKPWGHGQPDPIQTVLNATAVLQPVLSLKQQWRRGGVLRADEAPCCTRDTRLLSFVPSHSLVLSGSRLQFSFLFHFKLITIYYVLFISPQGPKISRFQDPITLYTNPDPTLSSNELTLSSGCHRGRTRRL